MVESERDDADPRRIEAEARDGAVADELARPRSRGLRLRTERCQATLAEEPLGAREHVRQVEVLQVVKRDDASGASGGMRSVSG